MRQVALVGSLGEVSRDLSSFVSKGVVLTIGAYLQANDGVKSNLTLLWCDKIKEYAIANFATGVRRVMGR